MEGHAPYTTEAVLTNSLGRPFNSVNDVIIHSDGSIWFTNPIYGFEQGYRPRPTLPNLVYRYDPATRDIRAIADGFGRQNGICFSPDEKQVYVTDTDWVHGDGSTDGSRVSSIYTFDVTCYSGQPFLTNRRLFAMADNGIPDGTGHWSPKIGAMVANELKIMVTSSGNRLVVKECLEIASQGCIKTHYALRKMADLSAAFTDLEMGKIKGKVIPDSR